MCMNNDFGNRRHIIGKSQHGKNGKRRFTVMLLSLFMAFIILLSTTVWLAANPEYSGYTPNVSVREADPGTMNSYIANLGTDNEYSLLLSSEWGSRYAGRLWSDKSVFATSLNGIDYLANTNLLMKYDGYNGLVFADADFLHAYSILGSSQVLNKYPPTPIDLMLVLDVSSSMQSGDDSNSRISRIVKAADALITELMQMNPYNRVGIVLFDNNPYIFVPLDHYEPANDYYDEKTGTGGFIDDNINPLTMTQNDDGSWNGIGSVPLNGSSKDGYSYTSTQKHDVIHYNFLSVEGGYPTLEKGYHGEDDAYYNESASSYGTGRTISFRYLKSAAYEDKQLTPWEDGRIDPGDWMSSMHANGLQDYNTTRVNGMTAEEIQKASEVTYRKDGSLHPAFASVDVAKDVNTKGLTGTDSSAEAAAEKVAEDTIVLSQITEGGTNMQGGYWLGLRMLAEADDTFVYYPSELYENTSRLPVFIMLSDGLANYAGDYSTWWAPGTVGIATRNTFVRRSGTSDAYPRWTTETYNWESGHTETDTLRALKPLMTAAYWKKVANANYQEELQFYTIGVEQTNVRARLSLNPTNYLTQSAVNDTDPAALQEAVDRAQAELEAVTAAADAALDAAKEAAEVPVTAAQGALAAAQAAEAVVRAERDALEIVRDEANNKRNLFSSLGSRAGALREQVGNDAYRTEGSMTEDELISIIDELLDIVDTAIDEIDSYWLRDNGSLITDLLNAVSAWNAEYASGNGYTKADLIASLSDVIKVISVHRTVLADARIQLLDKKEKISLDGAANIAPRDFLYSFIQENIRQSLSSGTENLYDTVRPVRYGWQGEYYRVRDYVLPIYTQAISDASVALRAAQSQRDAAVEAAQAVRDAAVNAAQKALNAAIAARDNSENAANHLALRNALLMTQTYLKSSTNELERSPRYYWAKNNSEYSDFTFFHPTNLSAVKNSGAYANPIENFGISSENYNLDYNQANYFYRRFSVPVLSDIIPVTVYDKNANEYNTNYDLDKIAYGLSGFATIDNRNSESAILRDAANPYMYGAYVSNTDGIVDSAHFTPDFYAQFDILSWDDLWFDDAYFNADAYQDNFDKIFTQILDLVKGYAFTPVGGTNEAGVDDSITYFDPIGDYMEIKNGRIHVTSGESWNKQGDMKIIKADMTLLLFGTMYEIERFGMYDYAFNSGWNQKYGSGAFTEGWYTSDDPDTAEYLGTNGSWENGNYYFVSGSTARQYVPTLDETGGTTDKQQNTMYTFYRFKRGGKDKDGNTIDDNYITSWRLNPGYDGRIPELTRGTDYNVDPDDGIQDYIITGDSMTAEYDTLQEEYSASGNVPNGVYRLSDIRIWVEDTGDYKDVDPGAADGGSLFAGLGYDQALYVNIPSNATPLQVAEITLDDTGVAYYVTNLGADHQGDNQNFYYQQSTPLRVFYSVGVTDDILDSEGEGIDLTKVSATYYINSHRREDYSVFFLSNYFTKGGANIDSGDPVVTFSPSTDNRYYVYQKNLLLYTKLYQVVDPDADSFNKAFKAVTGDDSWDNTDISHELKGTYKSKDTALSALSRTDNTLKVGDYIFIQTEENLADKLDDNAYYFIAIEYYQPTETMAEGKDIPEGAHKGRFVQYILCRTGFQLRAGNYGNLHRSEMLSWYNIDEATVGETGLTKEYAAGNDNSYPNPGGKGKWVLSTNPGGMRISDLDSSAKELKDKYGNEIDKDEVYPQYPNMAGGNVTETALNFYSPIVSQSSDAAKDIKINVYLGNNGRVRVEDSVLSVTKQISIPEEDAALVSASTLKALYEKPFTYQIYVEGFTGVHGAVRLKYEDDFWWRRFEAVWALTDTSGLLTYDSDVLVAVNSAGKVQNIGQGTDGLWYQLDEYKNIDYSKNVADPGELYYVYVKDARGITNDYGAALVYSDTDGVYNEYGTMSGVMSGTEDGETYYYKEFTADVVIKPVNDLSADGISISNFPIARTRAHIDGNPDSTYDIYSEDHFDLGAEFLTVYMYFGIAETQDAIDAASARISAWKHENGIDFVYPAPTILLDASRFSGGGKSIDGEPDGLLSIDLIKRHTAQFALSHGEGLLFNGIGENGDYRVTEKLWQAELDRGWDIWRSNDSETKPKGTPDRNIIDFTDVRYTKVAIRHAQDDIFTNYDHTGKITDIWSRWDSAEYGGWVNQLWEKSEGEYKPPENNTVFQNSTHIDEDLHIYSVFGDTSRSAEAVQYQNMFRPAHLEIGKTSAGRDNDQTEYEFEIKIVYETFAGIKTDGPDVKELTELVSLRDADYHAYKHVVDHNACTPSVHKCDQNGDTDTTVTFTGGIATVKLKSGEALVITGLPRGATYTVREIPPDQLTPNEERKTYIDVTKNPEGEDPEFDSENLSVTGRLNSADIEHTVEAVFVHYTNVFGDVNLIVKKRVEGTAGDREKEFHFTVTMYRDKERTKIVTEIGDDTDENGNVIGHDYGQMHFINGVAQFTLKHGESISGIAIVPPDDGNTPDVPVIYYFTVVEEDPDGHTVTWNGTAFKNTDNSIILTNYEGDGTTATGAIEADETASIEFVNSKDLHFVDLPGVGSGGFSTALVYSLAGFLIAATGVILLMKRRSYSR